MRDGDENGRVGVQVDCGFAIKVGGRPLDATFCLSVILLLVSFGLLLLMCLEVSCALEVSLSIALVSREFGLKWE